MPLDPEMFSKLEAMKRHRELARIPPMAGTYRIRVTTAEGQPVLFVSTDREDFIDTIVRHVHGYQDEAKTKHEWEVVGTSNATPLTAATVHARTNLLENLLS